MKKVVFVGAGPGAPDLLTVRGKEVIAQADVIIYAGSLVNPEILSFCRDDAEIYNSAGMTLDEVIDVYAKAVREGKNVARVHTGDPSIYGAEQEQMRRLDELGISYEVVPGVSSFLAAAASLKREYTLPGVSQSVILTRMGGRTDVPDSESIASLAAHKASMVVFLSVGGIHTLCEQLILGGYPKDTPAAVVYKASWEDEKQVRGTLSDIAVKVKEAVIERTALVLVGRFLDDDFKNSKLYDETYSHTFRKAAKRGAKRLMIQGTMSSAGKSFVTAALCRIFVQDGYSAAPFKSQNMALNSYVTDEGLEIGRAQAMQAEAAGIEPKAVMNPILLKPTGDEDSQVIVLGEVTGNMSAAEYYEKKAELMPIIERSFNELAGEYDIVIIEGAGSPVEINLKDNDIVNMGIAKMADAPVILVADIDRGGVFAQIVGTAELMEPDERARVKGIIINKFRGDADLLRPGIESIEKRLGIPVLGVIPMEEIDLDDEDSLSPRLEKGKSSGVEDTSLLNISVIRFPHISNFTDFSVLERWRGAALRYISDKKDLKDPDIIILPGTKNTMADLKWLKVSGLADEILKICKEGKTTLIGICGGYQMLGAGLSDPEGCEGEKDSFAEGLGLLSVNTVFADRKTRSQSCGMLTDEAAKLLTPGLADREIKGYEIHMGKTCPCSETLGEQDIPLLILEDGRYDGSVSPDGKCFGTYIHGIFDNTEWTKCLLESIAGQKGVSIAEDVENVAGFKESQYEKLADLVRCSVDMDAVYRILGES